jgi:putative addiction module killer protein
LRIHFGLGYRVYFAKKRELFVILLIGGDKSSQSKDIAQSKLLWQEIKNDDFEKL